MTSRTSGGGDGGDDGCSDGCYSGKSGPGAEAAPSITSDQWAGLGAGAAPTMTGRSSGSGDGGDDSFSDGCCSWRSSSDQGLDQGLGRPL